jgi:hypothetical protein
MHGHIKCARKSAHLSLALVEQRDDFRIALNSLVKPQVMSVHNRVDHSLDLFQLLLKLHPS